MKVLTAVFAVALTMAPTVAFSQDAPVGDQDIVVSGSLPEHSDLADAVRAVSRERGSDKPLQRYFDPICLHVTGMNPRANSFVKERILGNARQAGVEVDEGDCRANALVMAVHEPAELIALLDDRQPWIIASDNRTAIDASLAAREQVLVWHNTEDRSAQGTALTHSATVRGATGTATPLSVNVRVNSSTRARRVGATHSTAVVSAVVVLDLDALVGMDLERVGDFASMRLLAPGLEPRGHAFDVPTSVMWPFAADAGESELTRFDRAYLRALYGLQPNAAANVLTAAVVREYEGRP